MKNSYIQSYVPTSKFYNEKDHSPCRLLYEECAVVHAAIDWNVVAQSHAEQGAASVLAGFFAMQNRDSRAELLRAFTEREEKVLLLSHGGGTLLLFGTWYAQAKLLLSVWVKEPYEIVKPLFELAERQSDEADEYEATASHLVRRFGLDEEREDRLQGLFAHTSLLFGNSVPTNALTLLLTVAHFVGCRLHEVSVPPHNVYLNSREAQTLCAYLLCTFLRRRRHSGRINVHGDSGLHDSSAQGLLLDRMSLFDEYDLFITQKASDPLSPKSSDSVSPLSEDLRSLPCFADYSSTEDENGWNLSIPIRRKQHLDASFLPSHALVLYVRLLPCWVC